MTPLYLADVRAQEKDQANRPLLANGSFSVNKSEISCTAISAFHEIEQENQSLKVLGVIKVIANSTRVLAEIFLLLLKWATSLSFCETFGIEEMSTINYLVQKIKNLKQCW